MVFNEASERSGRPFLAWNLDEGLRQTQAAGEHLDEQRGSGWSLQAASVEQSLYRTVWQGRSVVAVNQCRKDKQIQSGCIESKKTTARIKDEEERRGEAQGGRQGVFINGGEESSVTGRSPHSAVCPQCAKAGQRSYIWGLFWGFPGDYRGQHAGSDSAGRR